MRLKKSLSLLASVLVMSSFQPPVIRQLNIVFIGDSITHGVLLKKAPPAYAQHYLSHRRKVAAVSISNQGVSGYTTVNFLPETGTVFFTAEKAAAALEARNPGLLVFSIMLGTNDSAEDGPLGSPVSPAGYRHNLRTIIDRLLKDFPEARVVVNYPIWYSPNTYNAARYLRPGLDRLQQYFPEIDTLVAHYRSTSPRQVYAGTPKVFDDFKKHYRSDYTPQKGQRGTFYLHPDAAGAAKLGTYWGKAIYRAIRN